MVDKFTQRVNDFFRKSLNFIDEEDLNREFSHAQSYYGKELLKKDLEIDSLNNQIEHFNSETNEIINNTNEIKNNLTMMQETLK